MAIHERWQQIEKLYNAAVTLAPADREPLLAAADSDVRREVESLLRQESTSGAHSIGGVDIAPEAAVAREQVGPYRIEAPLGAGGMGEVFRATDTRLDRPVAIKFCDPRFIARFAREARAISALNHPNICTLHDVGPNYLVMELIEGQTLAARLRQGPLALSEVLQYGSQIAGALAEAHAAGVVHRDLKPGNIMVTRHGVKVLDFGLAKLTASEDDSLTRTNTVMGTLAYMAPEQVKGQPADGRADLFALGLILHEMAAGKLPFPGASLGNMLASDDSATLPLPSRIRQGFPVKLDRLIARLLIANPANRLGDAGLVRDELQQLAMPAKAGHRAMIAAAAAVLVVAGGVWWGIGKSKPAPLQVENIRQIATFPGDKLDPALSPDGATVAFSWKGDKGDAPGIYLMASTGGQPRRLTSAPNEDIAPVFDPAGRRIAFLRLHPGQKSEAMYISIDGAGEQRLREVNIQEYLRRLRPIMAWTHDGKALAMPIEDLDSGGASLFRVPLDGGAVRRLVAGKNGLGAVSPAISADGRWLAYQQTDPSRLYAQQLGPGDVPQGEPVIVVDETDNRGGSPNWSPDGSQLWFARGQKFWDAATRRTETVYQSPVGIQSFAAIWKNPAVPDIVFSTTGGQLEVRTAELAEGGRKVAGTPQAILTSVWDQGISPDGRWLTFSSDASGSDEVWISNIHGEHRRQITHGNFYTASEPAWSPDGKHIAFHARMPSVAQIYIIDLDAEAEMALPESAKSKAAVRRITNNTVSLLGPSWSRDGKYLYVIAIKSSRILRLPSAGGEAEDLFEGDGDILDPDGRRIYYNKPDTAGLYSRSVEGDVRANPESRVLVDYTGPQRPGITKSGVVYRGQDAAGHPTATRYFEFASGKAFDITEASRDPLPHAIVTPDGRTLLFSQMTAGAGSLTLMQLRRGAN